MKLAHLGDALDAWKGWVIAAIRDETSPKGIARVTSLAR